MSAPRTETPLSDMLRERHTRAKDTSDPIILARVAQAVGISQAYVTTLLQGAADKAIRKWDGEQAFNFLRAFRCTTQEIREIAEKYELVNVQKHLEHLDLVRGAGVLGVKAGGPRVRFLGAVSAGRFGQPFASDDGELVSIPEHILKHHDTSDVFALEITGESMLSDEARGNIPPGAIAYFHSVLRPSPGQIICCRLERDDTSVIKVYRPGADFTTLESLNRKHRPIVVDEDNPARVEGVLLGVTIPF